MTKKKLSGFYCPECGSRWSKWMGKCPECNKWNTLIEDSEQSASESLEIPTFSSFNLKEMKEVRFPVGEMEFDRVLGGGLVPGSVVLLAGDPGVGKSTLLTMAMGVYCHSNNRIGLYVSGEETVSQIGARVKRLNFENENFHLCHGNFWKPLEKTIKKLKPAWVILDSIQTIQSEEVAGVSGGANQVREMTAAIIKMAKASEIPVVVVGHITKDGAIAGPKLLEHMVDTVLYFEWDRRQNLRILRPKKNRFGDTNEVGFYLMKDKKIEAIGEHLLQKMKKVKIAQQGEVLVLSYKNKKPVIGHIQVLISENNGGAIKRVVQGFELTRLNILVATLEKYLGLRMTTKDIYLDINTDLGKGEEYFDLGVIMALYSFLKKIKVGNTYLFNGKVELNGNIQQQEQIFVEKLEKYKAPAFSKIQELVKFLSKDD